MKGMTDTEKLHASADKLLEWLIKWPNKSGGKECNIRVELDGIVCLLRLEPKDIVSVKRQERVKRYMKKLGYTVKDMQ